MSLGLDHADLVASTMQNGRHIVVEVLFRFAFLRSRIQDHRDVLGLCEHAETLFAELQRILAVLSHQTIDSVQAIQRGFRVNSSSRMVNSVY